LSLGAVDDPVMVKLMDKVVDCQNQKAGTFHALVDADWPAAGFMDTKIRS
jgi:hypothetical protein